MTHTLTEDLDTIVGSHTVPWEQFAGKTILITGANGMLGSYLVESILHLNKTLAEKATVIALCRSKDKAQSRFKQYEHNPHFILLIQDVCDPILYKKDVHYIIHAASQASPKYYGIDPIGTFLPNVIGTNNILDFAHTKNVESVLFVSSSEVYGHCSDDVITEESSGYLDPLNVRSCYGESKRAGETLCVSWHHQHAAPVKIVRPFHCYGPSMRLDDGRVYADFVAAIVNKEPITLNSDGSSTRSFCYISDAIEAFFLVLLKGNDAQAYNVANPKEEISILNLAKTLIELFPETVLKLNAQSRSKDPNYLVSQVIKSTPGIDHIISLGWQPKTGIQEGFKRTVESFNGPS